MATDVKIDPETRDFVDTADGDWEEIDDATTAVMLQLDAREDGWWGDPPSGSRNAEIMESDLPTIDDLRDSTRRALGALVKAGVIADAFVNVGDDQDKGAGVGSLLIQWRDRSSNRPADLVYSPLGGKPT